MTRIRKLEITGFRGISGSLCLEFGAGGQSGAIFGENATGKSSVTDAVEWFYWNRVEHLWRENCMDSALRYVLLPEKQAATVELGFDDASLNCKKSISSVLSVSQSNKGNDFTAYLSKVRNQYERITLRNIDILSFVLQRKAEKRQELERIIGYEALNEFREIIRKTLYQLENAAEYTTAKSNVQYLQKDILTISRTVVMNEAELFSVAGKIAAAAGATTAILDWKSYTDAISELRTRIHRKDEAIKKAALSDCKQACETLAAKAGEVTEAFGVFSSEYSKLIASHEQIRQIRLGDFLAAGKAAIEEALVSADLCPLCLQAAPWDSLKVRLDSRIAALEAAKKEYDTAVAERNRFQAKLNQAASASETLNGAARKVGLDEAVIKPINDFAGFARALREEVAKEFERFAPLTGNIGSSVAEISHSVSRCLELATGQEAALELSKEEQNLIDAIQRLENLLDRFQKYKSASTTARSFETQINALSAIKLQFSVVHASALQNALDTMSEDISKYYLAMHPNENVDRVRLAVIEDGVEFEYEFHGLRVFPPLKYLSESHLNSIGIALFLASAKLFNKINRFFILDDVVTSFDSNHRIRLLRLLKDEFSTWQVIVLTHERFWFEMIKKELGPAGWLISELEVLPGRGVQLKSSPQSAKQQIMELREKGTLTANDLRSALERILKELALRLEVKIAYRYNDMNERRMVGELLSALRGTLKKKSPATLSAPAFSKLEVCSLVVTSGSHDSGAPPVSGDIATSCEDVINFDGEFYCDECGHYVDVERLAAHERKIYCKCGKKSLDWKE